MVPKMFEPWKLDYNILFLFTGELLKEQEHLRQLMGDSVEEQRRKFQERLIRRKQRQAAGTNIIILRCTVNVLKF